MVQFVCNCLNIDIHCKDIKGFEHCEHDNCDTFFNNALEATLTLAGIIIEHDYLCWTRVVGQWVINQCAVCSMDTHAWRVITDNSLKTILVNAKLERNVSLLRQNVNYSPIFRIVLPAKDDNIPPKIASPLKKSLETEATRRSLQQRVHRFLNEEQKSMEERIRTFTEQEHARFASLQLKIGRDEELLMELFNSITGKSNRDTNNLKNQIMNRIKNDQIDDEKFEFSIENRKQNQVIDAPKMSRQKKHFSKDEFSIKPSTFSHNPPAGGRMRSQSLAVDFGGVFDLDEDEDGHAFDSISYSDGEDDESLTITEDSDNGHPQKGRINIASHAQISHNHHRNAHQEMSNAPSMAFSLPITVPQWQKQIIHDNDHVAEEDDNVPILSDTEDMAQRMAKIARSVRNESDDIFGDLPRRRLNTGDLIKSRPI